MSDWVCVNGTIEVSADLADLKKIMLDLKAMITGSEGSCEVFLNRSKRVSSTVTDYIFGIPYVKKRYNNYILSFNGHLRNRSLDTSFQEVKTAITYISDSCLIRSIGIVISDGISVETITDIT